MTKEEYRKLHKIERVTLNDSLNIVTSFMTDKCTDRKAYKESLRSNIDNFFCKRTHKKKVEESLGYGINAVGICKSIPKRRLINKMFKRYKGTKLNSEISINDSLSNNYLSNLMVAIHEVNHADTNQYLDCDNNTYYVGYRKGIRTNGDNWIVMGDGLVECFTELYTQISFYQKVPKCYTNINSVDDLIYKPYKPVFTDNIIPNGEIYRDLGLLAKLLIIACDNDLGTSYTSLKNDCNNFVSKSVKLNDGMHYVKNDALYAGKYGTRGLEKNFDELSEQKGSFENLLKRFDYLLDELRKHERPNKMVVADIIRQIDYYKDKKYKLMVKKGLWSPIKKLRSDMIYQTYRTYVKSMFRLYPAKVTSIPVEEETYTYKLKKTGND